MDEIEERVSSFYNTVAWKSEGDITEAARIWEDLREHARAYGRKCRLRVFRHIPESGENMLDMGSGPIQFKEYIEYSRHFKRRYCIDLSSRALEGARKKIGDHGVFLFGSFLDIPLEDNFFDCAVSILALFNIDKDKQEAAVRKLIAVTKPGKPVIVVYRNPNPIDASLRSFWASSLCVRVLRKAKAFLRPLETKPTQENDSILYFYAHPVEWWNRFSDAASVKILPWRSFTAGIQKALIPDNKLGSMLFDVLFNLEERFPDFFARSFHYPMIILTKRT